MAEEKSRRDEQFREESLNGNLWRLLIRVGAPLAFYQMLTSFYNIVDSLIASHINADAVSTVAYLSEISAMAQAVGMGLALGGSVNLARAYGAGDYKKVSNYSSTLVVISFIAMGAVFCVLPFSGLILRLGGTSKEMIAAGSAYFAIQLSSVAIAFFNDIYIAIEKARGNTKRIFAVNTVIIVIKLGLTAFFVYVLHSGVTMIAVASLIAQLLLMLFGVFMLTHDDSAFRFRFRNVRLKRDTVMPMISLGTPVTVEHAVFSVGKVAVNYMCSRFGTMTVGALGISNKYSGVTNGLGNGFKDGGTSIISQNMGAGNYRRALDAWKKEMIICFGLGVFGMIVLVSLLGSVSDLFAMSSEGFNAEFRDVIRRVAIFEAVGAPIPICIAHACSSMIYSLGKTKEMMIINMVRLFVLRIFVLWVLQTYTNLGVECAGIVMVVSNTGYAVILLIMTLIEVKKLKREKGIA